MFINNNRKCGDCTLCCIIPPIHEVNSPPNNICPFCIIKGGCTIYNTRPQTCKNFNCEWLLNDNLSENLKPEISKIFFEKIKDNIYMGIPHKDYLNAWENFEVFKYIKELNKKGISVIISPFAYTHKTFILANGHTKKQVMKEIMKEYNKEFIISN